MDRTQFSSLLRDALANIHDYAVLEKHALNEFVPRPNPTTRKAENLRSFIRDGIHSLKPPEGSGPIDSLEWRYYHILSGRYIEGLSVAEMQKRLALGERQERRMHSRAVELLDEVLWDRIAQRRGTGELRAGSGLILPQEGGPVELTAESLEEDSSFPVSLEPLHLHKLIEETGALVLPQLQARGSDVSMQVPASLPMIQADRIILRQVLLHLFHRVLQNLTGGEVAVSAGPGAGTVRFQIRFRASAALAAGDAEYFANPLFSYWVARLNARLQIETEPLANRPGEEATVRAAFILDLPQANQARILVVDDHEPAIRIVQRCLSQTSIQAVGVSDPAQVLPTARALLPRAVLLDVMMPTMDGWEILQKLKSDPTTGQIPVIICSVWEQPELAYSLGADMFLKKPINPAELLAELARLGLLDSAGGSLPAGS